MKRFLSLILAITMAFTMVACGGSSDAESNSPSGEFLSVPGTEDGVLTVGMECQYAPYNWTQLTSDNGAVEISNNPGAYANGYDVMVAQKICEKYGWTLEVMALEWGGLTPAINAGTIDVAIAGQSMTAERMAEVDMAGPYYYAEIVCLTTKDSANASATSVSELTGIGTAQAGTIWYNSCLPQATNATVGAAAETAPAMVMALNSGTADFVVTDLPTATAAVSKDDNLVVLNFSGTDGDFQFADETERAENVNIGVSVKKGNTELQTALNDALAEMGTDTFNSLMDNAIAVQPEI